MGVKSPGPKVVALKRQHVDRAIRIRIPGLVIHAGREIGADNIRRRIIAHAIPDILKITADIEVVAAGREAGEVVAEKSLAEGLAGIHAEVGIPRTVGRVDLGDAVLEKTIDPVEVAADVQVAVVKEETFDPVVELRGIARRRSSPGSGREFGQIDPLIILTRVGRVHDESHDAADDQIDAVIDHVLHHSERGIAVAAGDHRLPGGVHGRRRAFGDAREIEDLHRTGAGTNADIEQRPRADIHIDGVGLQTFDRRERMGIPRPVHGPGARVHAGDMCHRHSAGLVKIPAKVKETAVHLHFVDQGIVAEEIHLKTGVHRAIGVEPGQSFPGHAVDGVKNAADHHLAARDRQHRVNISHRADRARETRQGGTARGVQQRKRRTGRADRGVETSAAQQRAGADLHVQHRAVQVGDEARVHRAGSAVGNLGHEETGLGADVLKHAANKQGRAAFQHRGHFAIAVRIPSGVEHRRARRILEAAQRAPRRHAVDE